MFSIYKEIANQLRENVPELRTIDADKGQLADPEHAFPISYPAVLIDLDAVDWGNQGKLVQKGKSQIGITVAVQPTGHAHQSSPTLDNFVNEMQVITDVYAALQGFLNLTRTKTTRKKRYDTLQAYTHIFTNTITDNSAKKTLTKVEASPVIVGKGNKSIAAFPGPLK